jgi:hypothetical protein
MKKPLGGIPEVFLGGIKMVARLSPSPTANPKRGDQITTTQYPKLIVFVNRRSTKFGLSSIRPRPENPKLA